MYNIRKITFIDRLMLGGNEEDGILIDNKNYNIFENIRLNLEFILNTKKTLSKWNNKFYYIDKSVFNYGIRDFSGTYVDDILARDTVCKEIENVINIFENRLNNVKVSLNIIKQHDIGNIYFNIEADLLIAETNKKIIYYSNTKANSPKIFHVTDYEVINC